ncbi:C2 domain protein [Talaromyces proteolyticus]|uniref:C2 domain protein n=1 Tax=Talaromyces proteolyticus TaxID=1131652 RepID=A0AAD4Q197_9EURO|nr:C2 domain protein [Talaromyces proteolyticus]KAH8698265.1 C2 domain protein [Talaromyces proteolyticus]
MDNEVSPEVRHRHVTEVYGTKFVDKTQKAHDKAIALARDDDSKLRSEKSPPGGFDETPIPRVPPGFTLKFTFHQAKNLPVADFNTLSSDPFVRAELRVDLPKRHKQDPEISFRTHTVRRDVNPVWDSEWIVANVPASGFHLKCRVFDEDPADHDDRLGNAHVIVDNISKNWRGIQETSYHIKKRAGSKRAYFFRTLAATCSPKRSMNAELIMSVECLGRTPTDNGGHMYTLGPLYWFKHFSPLIGRILKTSVMTENQDAKGKSTRYNFQAVQIQLRGPVPEELYHRYVEFKPFVAGMFTSQSLRGRILNRALHHQHARIYNFDRSTMNGQFPSPSTELTQLFLDFVDHGRGGKIFTYVLTLDGHMRFTETGKEFGIDLLSKHTMHSDVSIYIAFSGEFFVRLRKKHHHRRQQSNGSTENTSSNGEVIEGNEAHDSNENNDDSIEYELMIDNDSGTYRPNADKLHLLQEFLSANFPGLHVTTLDCQKDAERMNRLKEERRMEKKQSQGQLVYMQQVHNSESSLSSSDEEDMRRRGGQLNTHQRGNLARNFNEMKDVRGKFRHWLEATDEPKLQRKLDESR